MPLLPGMLPRHTSIFSCALAALSAMGLVGACGVDESPRAMQDSIAAAARVEGTRTIATWNTIALRTTAAGVFSPPQESRSMAIVSAAVFDAVNAVSGQYEPFIARVVAAKDASPAAAHHALRALYPSAAPALDADYDSTLARIPDGASKTAGIAGGEVATATCLSKRANDHAADRVSYTLRNTPGMWTPTPPAFVAALEAGWGRVSPFVLDSGSQFRPPPPPAMGSATYSNDLKEIAAIGVSNSQTRTAAQTEAARFWISTAAQLRNQAARQLTVARGLDPATAARVYLMLNVSGADATIAAWDAKFVHDQWRPVTGIRFGAASGSLASPIDTTWTPLITTPPFPDYPAGHTAFAGAAEVVLTALLGAQPGEFTITSATAGGIPHRYSTFNEVADEVTNARVWGGVHWRTSSTVGRDMGRRVGELALLRVARRH